MEPETQPWEIRSALRYGSKHEGFFDTKDHAMKAAADHIRREDRGGFIECEVGRVIYYNPWMTKAEAEEV